jgi:hypothetical protein
MDVGNAGYAGAITGPKPTAAVVFRIGSTSKMLVQALHEPTDVKQPLASALDSPQREFELRLQRLALLPASNDRGRTEELSPAREHLFIRQL